MGVLPTCYIERVESKLTFFGGAGSVTGANFLLETGGKRILIDCGLEQGGNSAMERNYEDFQYDPSTVDVLFVTHAHADHIGRIPKLVRDGFRGVIYSTPATRDLSEVMFADALGILAEDALKRHRTPLYDTSSIEMTLGLWKTYEYHAPFAIEGDISVRFLDAGHVLGSAMIEFKRSGRVFVATGDLGNSPAPLLRDTEALSAVNYLLMESVYGDRVHEERENRLTKLHEILEDTYTHNRTLLIPAFAIERTQILLYELNTLVESKQIPEMPVYLDSPLASRVTDIYRRYTRLFNEQVQKEIALGDDVLSFPKFTVIRDSRESAHILDMPSPKAIIAASGMSVGGRVLMHEKRLLSDPDTTILFVGYQGAGTLGRHIQDGEPEVLIEEETVPVRARVETIRGFSAHKDSDGLIEVVQNTRETLDKVFVAMGEPKSAQTLARRIHDSLGIDVVTPSQGETHILAF